MLSPTEVTGHLSANPMPGHSYLMALKHPLFISAKLPLSVFQLAPVTPYQEKV